MNRTYVRRSWHGGRHGHRQPSLAREERGGWHAAESEPGSAIAQLGPLVDRVQQRDIDELSEPAILAELRALELASRRIGARTARLTSALTTRRAKRARVERPDDTRAPERAVRATHKELQDELSWTPSQAKRTDRVGGQLGASPEAREALDAGRLTPRHAELLAATLRDLEDPDVLERLQSRLVEAAQHEDTATFGRTCRELLAEVDSSAAMRGEDRRRGRRRAAVVPTDDGMIALHGQWSGLDGEYVASAVHAFRRQDGADEHRTAEQVTADAVAALARAALDAGTAQRQHGVRPHVTVTIPYEAVVGGDGSVTTPWSGPLPYAEVRRALADAGVARLLTDARSVPIEAGEQVRSVPAGVYRAVTARDRGCIAEGCDVPGAWCEVMHLDVPYRLDGRLTINTAALGCSFHHGRFDRGQLVLWWVEGRPVLQRRAGAAAGGSTAAAGRTVPGTMAAGDASAVPTVGDAVRAGNGVDPPRSASGDGGDAATELFPAPETSSGADDDGGVGRGVQPPVGRSSGAARPRAPD